ncbi:AsmA family protein [Massilia sp. MB5]|uniref:AsmA family protein n=1 Tax=Massilia sp. MB5 TaxID=2919578 RepID=UPI001F10A6DB|nr:AsmA family protein [Massilia sp. MB5]UMR28587.1 AsmA family protein [Massilia sp. MB5]
MSLSRRTKLALAAGGVLLAVPAAALIVLYHYDWNKARPWLNEKVSAAIERPFAIRGTLALSWQRQPQELGWRSLVPWPHLLARDVHLGNPAPMLAAAAHSGDAVPADMASAAELSFSLNPLALLEQKITIPLLSFTAPQVYLQRTADGKNNWTFQQNRQSPWRLDLQRVVFSKGSVRLVDAPQHIDATAHLDTLAQDSQYGVSWRAAGRWNKQPVSGQGKAGAVLSLQGDQPFPLQGKVQVGLVHIAAEGTLTRPLQLAAIDFRLKVGGASMARLYALTGLVLPETPPFATEGRLRGTLAGRHNRWTYEQFTGRVGSSDIAGQLVYEQKQPRGHLSGTVQSKLLQFADLGPLIGADSNASKQARGLPAVQPSEKVLPVETFKTERWTSIDADVSYRAARIVRTEQLPISHLETEFHLRDGVLKLTPLNFDFAGGKLASTVTLDGSGRDAKNAIRADLAASARGIRLKELFPHLPQLQATVGVINADTRLSATGNSVATLLAQSNGELKTRISQGQISKLLLEQMGLNIGSIVLTKLVGDKQVKLNCLAGDFAVTDGLAQTRSFIVDTEDATVRISGAVSLDDERLDLTMKPDSKGLRIISLRSPIYVRGTFKHPDVDIDKGVLALRAGGAIALATLAAPVAALAPLISGGGSSDTPCAPLLAEAARKPVAPPPGKKLAPRRQGQEYVSKRN